MEEMHPKDLLLFLKTSRDRGLDISTDDIVEGLESMIAHEDLDFVWIEESTRRRHNAALAWALLSPEERYLAMKAAWANRTTSLVQSTTEPPWGFDKTEA